MNIEEYRATLQRIMEQNRLNFEKSSDEHYQCIRDYYKEIESDTLPEFTRLREIKRIIDEKVEILKQYMSYSEINDPLRFMRLDVNGMDNDTGSRLLKWKQGESEMIFKQYKILIGMLKTQIEASLQHIHKVEVSLPKTLKPPAMEEMIKLTHSQIAMLYHYTGQLINRNNATDIARKYGHNSPTSGQKLEKTYKDLTSELIRTATGKYTLTNFDAVLPLLSGDALELANKELIQAKRNNKK